jgi:hypothetical protein
MNEEVGPDVTMGSYPSGESSDHGNPNDPISGATNRQKEKPEGGFIGDLTKQVSTSKLAEETEGCAVLNTTGNLTRAPEASAPSGGL